MPEKAPVYDVAIVGYGPTGATLANLLGLQGVSVAVLERELVLQPRAVHFDGEVMRVFGPRIIELDWLIRRHDPVLTKSHDAVRELVARTGCSVTQMGTYGDRIVTIHHERGPEALEINRGAGLPARPHGGRQRVPGAHPPALPHGQRGAPGEPAARGSRTHQRRARTCGFGASPAP